jgi:hypothetical protein
MNAVHVGVPGLGGSFRYLIEQSGLKWVSSERVEHVARLSGGSPGSFVPTLATPVGSMNSATRFPMPAAAIEFGTDSPIPR